MTRPLLEYDEAADAAYILFSDDEWHDQERLDDGRAINFAADGSVIGVELRSRRTGAVAWGRGRSHRHRNRCDDTGAARPR